MKQPLIQITKSATVFSGSDNDLNQLGKEFKKQHYIKLPGFLEPNLLQFVQNRIEKGGFYEDRYKVGKGDAADYRLKDKSTDSLLRFLMNDQILFQLIEQFTGCPQIESFKGAVYCLAPNCGHYDTWHTDDWDHRMVSISINLSTDVYSGGVLQIRNHKSKKILTEIANTGFGDAIIFPVSSQMEHKVTDVAGKAVKTAFPGWFKSRPKYLSMLKKLPKSKIKISTAKQKVSMYSVIVAKKELFSRVFDGHMLIFDPDKTVCYELDSIGEKVLSLLKEPITIKEVIDSIISEYDIDEKQFRQDLLELFQEMITNEIIILIQEKSLSNNLLQTKEQEAVAL